MAAFGRAGGVCARYVNFSIESAIVRSVELM